MKNTRLLFVGDILELSICIPLIYQSASLPRMIYIGEPRSLSYEYNPQVPYDQRVILIICGA